MREGTQKHNLPQAAAAAALRRLQMARHHLTPYRHHHTGATTATMRLARRLPLVLPRTDGVLIERRT